MLHHAKGKDIMKKYIGPNGEKMTRVRRDEIPPISAERLAEIEAIRDEDIDLSDIPDMGDNEEFWKNGVVRWPEKKEHITIRLDTWVIDYFKRKGGPSGRGYQSRINEALRSFVINQMM